MYYDNGNYMQDLNYYNQNPVQNFGYNPYMMNNFNNQQFQMGMRNQQNLNSMYPATYRIICPVVSQVVANTNIQYITEDSLNNMVEFIILFKEILIWQKIQMKILQSLINQ